MVPPPGRRGSFTANTAPLFFFFSAARKPFSGGLLFFLAEVPAMGGTPPTLHCCSPFFPPPPRFSRRLTPPAGPLFGKLRALFGRRPFSRFVRSASPFPGGGVSPLKEGGGALEWPGDVWVGGVFFSQANRVNVFFFPSRSAPSALVFRASSRLVFFFACSRASFFFFFSHVFEVDPFFFFSFSSGRVGTHCCSPAGVRPFSL